ncbi:hypothetical protein [Hymenobacter cavernae]|uniref:DUF2953 domain-containing protein n=1 Tax=Hymenobacter cavernae TaxID=2044852 RepID=A0ABQ1U671_9BACT|nr:hypothetical protein [Hymenobacter cavernae]GGF11477.1 hypothetical protein GCM10011383_23370 [Hymenobacter cavernae]
MNYHLLWIIPLGIGGFVALWCLVVKLVSFMGWHQLAKRFQTDGLPAGAQMRLQRARIGVANYKGVLTASVSAEGMGLKVGFPFQIGHPPVLIPWAAFGPFRAEKFLWTTFYTTTISTGNASTSNLGFVSQPLVEAARPWIRVEGK